MSHRDLEQIAEFALREAEAAGANEAAVRVAQGRFVDIKQREGRTETLQASESRGLTLSLYVDKRYSSNATSFLQPEALSRFIRESLTMTRMLSADPHRSLPAAELYGPTAAPIDSFDAGYDAVPMDRRKSLVAAAEEAARNASDEVISATAELTTQSSWSLQLHSNGFRGERAGTSYACFVVATVRDEGDRRPEAHDAAVARHLDDFPDTGRIGAEAARRALARRGAAKAATQRATLVVENRVASRLVSSLLAPLSAAALQQRRSVLEGKLGQRIGSNLLSIVDDPLIPRGLGSRTFDSEGLAVARRPVFEAGQLSSYFVDVYYGRKLGMAPTSGSSSNLLFASGAEPLSALIANVPRGIFVTGFLGGNANPATGDFSFGIEGHVIQNGELGQPVSEMNIADNHLEFWQRLEAVGNDPYAYSAARVPSLVFADVQFSGA